MTIYLACTVRGDRGGVLAGRAICERLEHHGHEVQTKHLLADNVETAESRISERDVFRRDLDWLTACDTLRASWSCTMRISVQQKLSPSIKRLTMS